jgi:hypothetical protein
MLQKVAQHNVCGLDLLYYAVILYYWHMIIYVRFSP